MHSQMSVTSLEMMRCGSTAESAGTQCQSQGRSQGTLKPSGHEEAYRIKDASLWIPVYIIRKPPKATVSNF